MAMVKQSGEKITSPHPAIKLPKLPWTQILAISIFWLGLNFHQNRARMPLLSSMERNGAFLSRRDGLG